MPSLPKIAIIVAAAALGFIGGAITSAHRGWGSSLVSVVVENRTTLPATSVNLNLSSCGAASLLSVQNLRPGQSHTFRFDVCGEGGYKLDVMLENKTALSSAAYVENGYKVTELIEPLRIRSETQTYGL